MSLPYILALFPTSYLSWVSNIMHAGHFVRAKMSAVFQLFVIISHYQEHLQSYYRSRQLSYAWLAASKIFQLRYNNARRTALWKLKKLRLIVSELRPFKIIWQTVRGSVRLFFEPIILITELSPTKILKLERFEHDELTSFNPICSSRFRFLHSLLLKGLIRVAIIAITILC